MNYFRKFSLCRFRERVFVVGLQSSPSRCLHKFSVEIDWEGVGFGVKQFYWGSQGILGKVRVLSHARQPCCSFHISCACFSESSDKNHDAAKSKSLATTCQDSDGIMKVLHVAEKNDAAKRIAHLLANGVVNTRNGYSVYNKLYEFQYNFRNQNCQMTMTSVSGHLLNYEFDPSFKKWHSCDPVQLFDAPVAKGCTENMAEIKRTLEHQAPYFQVLIIWTDCDREGENIGFEVISVCTAINPRLQVLRAKFSEITKQAVFNAMNNLVQPDKRVSDAVDVRQELDLRIGAAFTRFQTLRLTRKFPVALADRLISYGSCQFPTLGFVVERYKSIQDFVREDFWKIDVSHKKDDFMVNFSWARVRLFNKLAVQTIYEACLDDPTARVTKVQSKPKNKWRPVALDTIELEKLASRKLRIGAKEAMQIAEQLYTKGFISYPRTETNIFPPGIDLAALVQQQTESNQWGGFATRMLQTNGPNPRNGKKSDQAHPPIHPTKFDNLNGLSDKHKKVYELIVRHFLACCSKDAIGKETIVEIDIADEKFVASGLTVIERNYLEVYIYDKWSDKEIPDFQNGETFRPTKIEMTEGRTSPPNLLTEADLIALMERHGIGTDATHAEHIETIKNRQYVGLQGIHFVPGKLGMGLVEGYDAMGFEMSKPRLRAQLESDLQKICEGTRRPQDVLREQVQKYKQVFIQATDQVIRLDEALARLLNDGNDNNSGGGANGGYPVNPRGRGGNNDDDDDDDDDRGGGGGIRNFNATARTNATRNHGNDVGRRDNFVNQHPPPPSLVPRVTSRHATNSTAPSNLTCHCGNIPETYTTKKQGPNLGRQFFKCQECGFFVWADEAQSSGNQCRRPVDTTNNRPQTFSGTNASFRGAPSIPLNQTSSSYGDYNQRSQPNNRATSTQSARNNSNSVAASGEFPNCKCEKRAVSYTVKKEGANKGRKFFGCATPYGAQEPRCDFFSWDDQGVGQSNDQGPRNTQPAFVQKVTRGRGGSSAQGGRRARKCGICHQEGHTRRNCPLAGDDDDGDMEYS